MLARTVFFVLLGLPVALFSCSKDRPAPVAPAGKSLASLAAPAAPTNLRFDAPTDSSCTVRWDASDGATDYDVNYRPTVGGRWTNEPHRGTGLYNTIHGLQPNTEYRWAVRAENSDGTSAWVFGSNFTTRSSEDDDLSDGLASPTNLRFDAPTDSSCTVRWDASDGATDYDVNYKPAVGGRWTNEPHRGTGLYNTIHDLEPDTEYRWAVRAENSDGTSEWIHGPNFTTLSENQDGQDDGQGDQTDAASTASELDTPIRLTKLYLVSSRGIHQVNPDGTDGRTLIYPDVENHGVLANWDLSLDIDQGKMYWLEERKDRIGWANLDGSQVQEILTREDGLRRPECLAVGAGKIFWSGYLVKSRELEYGLYRANIDGSHIETIFNDWAIDIALDVHAEKVYWTSYQPNAIRRANLDGSDVEILVSDGVGTSSRAPLGFAIDLHHGYMYWLQPRPWGIYRANLDGVVETVLLWEVAPWWEDTLSWNDSHGFLRYPRGLAVDSTAGKMYWLAESDIGNGKTILVRNNLDGSHVETFTIDGGDRQFDHQLSFSRMQGVVPLFE